MKKINYLLIAILFIPSISLSMDPSSKNTSSKKSAFGKIKQNLRGALTSFFSENPQKTNVAMQEIKKLSQEEESLALETPNKTSSTEEKYSVQIIDFERIIPTQALALLIATINARSLQEAGNLISSLSLVNKEFHELLNERDLCLQIIKYLSARFNCSNILACSALKIDKAKYLLERQLELFKFCQKKGTLSLNDNVVITGIYLQGIDLEFTYDYAGDQATALIVALLNESDVAEILMTLGANINTKSKKGLTPLEIAQESNNIKFLEFIQKGEYKNYAKYQKR